MSNKIKVVLGKNGQIQNIFINGVEVKGFRNARLEFTSDGLPELRMGVMVTMSEDIEIEKGAQHHG
jgi:hypothetical protein